MWKMVIIVNFGSNKTPKIGDVLKQIGQKHSIIDWNKIEKVDWKEVDKIILSGAPILLSKVVKEEYIKPFTFLKEINKPILGICFGHQLLGLLFGAEVFLGTEVRQESNVTIILKEKLFDGFSKSTLMIEDHTEGITLPTNFIQLASSDKYNVEAMKHHTKDIYGVQFHPEVSGENGIKLLTNFCKI